MPERIQLKRTKGWRMPPNTVKVTRGKGMQFGNPYAVGQVGPSGIVVPDQESAVGFFCQMLEDDEIRISELYPTKAMIKKTLAGKNLACWCKLGAPCHADVLLKIANE